MSCYDEERSSEHTGIIRSGPTVVRDQQNVREIADDLDAFALHVRPRYKRGREDCWGRED
jgi:hypothetical protein